MTNCERFEQLFRPWKKGELTPEEASAMARHSEECTYCRDFTEDIYRLRLISGSVNRLEPRLGFENRLARRIREIERGAPAKVKSPQRIPVWAGLGAGLATGAAVGMALLLSGRNDSPAPALTASPPPAYIASNSQIQSEKDTTDIGLDSINRTGSSFDASRHSQMVSTPR